MTNDFGSSLGRALRLMLAATAVGSFLPLPSVLAAVPTGDGERDATELVPMLVTGSHVPTVEQVTASPVDVVEGEVLRKVAATDVLDLLRKTSPNFLGSGNSGSERNLGGTGESNLSLRNMDTLVLLNGRRLAGSSFSAGAAVDLSTIPASMIERVEVLKDGASAIYGADAIGGVANVILKKGYSGAEVGAQYGFTTRRDDYQQYSGYVTGGISNERTSIAVGAQYYHNDPLRATDRGVAAADLAELAARRLVPQGQFSQSLPGRIVEWKPDGTRYDYLLAGSPYAAGHPGYRPGMTSIPDAYLGPGRAFTVDQLVADGVYLPIGDLPRGQALAALGQDGYPLMNTSLEGPYALLRQDRRQVAVNAEHELFRDRLTVYGDFLFSDQRNEAVLAAAPFWGVGPGTGVGVIPATNPYNPFGTDLDVNTGSPWFVTRFQDVGPRVYRSDTSYYRVLGGLKGRLGEESGAVEDLEWTTGFNYNLSDQRQEKRNFPSGEALSLALQPDFAADPGGRLSMLKDAAGQPVPTYDYFGLPGNPRNDPRTLNAMRVTLFQEGISELMDAEAVVSARALSLPAGKIGWAVGGQFRWEDLDLAYDNLTRTGQAIGENQIQDFPGGDRNASAAFVEARIPILGPEMGLAWARSLDLSVAGRFEHLDPGGDAWVPKVGVRWEPVGRNMVLRGTYSEGYIAPTLYSLYGAPATDYPTVTLTDGTYQQRFTLLSDPNLEPSTARTWTGGVVFTPEAVRGLMVSVDYYTIDNPGLAVYDFQALVDSVNRLGPASPYAGNVELMGGAAVTAPGQLSSASWNNANIRRTPGAEQRTDGLDLTTAYEWRTDHAGTFLVSASANVLLNYEFSKLPGAPFHEFSGQYTMPDGSGGQGTLPRWNLASSLTWDYRDFTFAAYSRYIPPVDDWGGLHPSRGQATHGGTTLPYWRVDDWFTVDLQLAYEIHRGKPITRWYDGFRFAVGVNNVSDEEVPFVASSDEDNTDKVAYNILGRFAYLQISKKF